MELSTVRRGMERVVAPRGTPRIKNRIMATVVLMRLPRERAFSFEAAMLRLGGRVLSTEQAGAFSSEIESEQVEDSIRILAAIACHRHSYHQRPTARGRKQQVFSDPRDQCRRCGGGQHPTQALLIFTPSIASVHQWPQLAFMSDSTRANRAIS